MAGQERLIYLWDAAAGEWVKAQAAPGGITSVNVQNFPATYPLSAAQIALLRSITNYPDPVISQPDPAALKHSPQTYDPTTPAWRPLASNASGHLLVQLAALAELNDITDVSVPAPTGGYFLYWNSTNSRWECKAVPIIQDADADTKVDVEEAADEDKIHMDVKGVEAFLLSDLGIATLAKQSACRVSLSANQIIPTGVNTKIAFDTEAFDRQNEFDGTRKVGVADATGAFKLHDADGGFEIGDVLKTVWNTTDNTYTYVTAFVDSGELTLNDDIMVDTEGYILFNSRFTAKESGLYAVTAMGIFVSVTDQMSIRLYIRKSGVVETGVLKGASGTNYDGVTALAFFELAALDSIDFQIYQASGVAKSLYGGAAYRTSCAIAKIA